jgi:hypothetical protein
MEPVDEVDRRRFSQRPRGISAVDLALKAYVRARLDLEISAPFSHIKLIGERPFDFAWGCVVTLDQVGIVAVHYANSIGEARRRLRMKAAAKPVAGR